MKPKACKVCNSEYAPRYTLQAVCSIECALRQSRAKRMASERKAQRAKDKRWKADNKKLGKLVSEAQIATNWYVRMRDWAKPCISCNRTRAEIEASDPHKPGGYFDAGHFQSVGAHPEADKRFNLLNINAQCKVCNGGSGQYARKRKSVDASYRAGMVERYGLEVVERLEGPSRRRKMTREELVRWAKMMRRRARHYKKLRGVH